MSENKVDVPTTKQPESRLKGFLHEIRPNALWDGIKLLVYLGGAGVLMGLYRLIAAWRHIPQDAVIDALIFLVSLLCLSLGAYAFRRQRPLIAAPASQNVETLPIPMVGTKRTGVSWLIVVITIAAIAFVVYRAAGMATPTLSDPSHEVLVYRNAEPQIIVRDKKFFNERIVLDDHAYIGCAFDSCAFSYAGTGAVGLEYCTFYGPVRLTLIGHPTMGALELLHAFHMLDENVGQLDVQKDQSVTLSKRLPPPPGVPSVTPTPQPQL